MFISIFPYEFIHTVKEPHMIEFFLFCKWANRHEEESYLIKDSIACYAILYSATPHPRRR